MHFSRIRPIMRDILAIERVILRYDNDVDATIMFINGRYLSYEYSYDCYDKSLTIFRNIDDLVKYNDLKGIDSQYRGNCAFGVVTQLSLPESILKYINNSERLDLYEHLIDIN